MIAAARTAPAGAHERHRARLEALADDGLLAAVVGARAVERRFERFQPHADACATLAVEDVGPDGRVLRVDVFASRPTAVAPGGRLVAAPPAGWFVVRSAGTDPGLPGLAAVLEGAARARIVRYRPGRRCTVSVEDAEGVRFARVGPGAAAAHDATAAVHAAAARGELGFAAARPLGVEARAGVAWQAALPGAPADDDLFGARGTALAARMGAAAATLAASSLRPRARLDARVCLDEAGATCRELRTLVPALGPELDELETWLHDLLGRPAARPPCAIHGDMNPPNWLVDGGRLGLVDLERLALGEPEVDVATWVAEVEAETGSGTPVAELVAAFAAAFEAVAGPLDARRLAGHLAHRRLWKVLKAARALRPDGDVRAQRRLAAVLDALGRDAA